ncbi:hypothetical protein P7K49_037555 [Saguinus oedipus]|uniref:Uncharacterized protein n=1 Tax=Saguinus oedipus TaxID=9490 RepID=A0ABQ9TIE9_SAGOE|nr:hypothetical protein P7K49_037555 [Saguinus oedipus]
MVEAGGYLGLSVDSAFLDKNRPSCQVHSPGLRQEEALRMGIPNPATLTPSHIASHTLRPTLLLSHNPAFADSVPICSSSTLRPHSSALPVHSKPKNASSGIRVGAQSVDPSLAVPPAWGGLRVAVQHFEWNQLDVLGSWHYGWRRLGSQAAGGAHMYTPAHGLQWEMDWGSCLSCTESGLPPPPASSSLLTFPLVDLIQ